MATTSPSAAASYSNMGGGSTTPGAALGSGGVAPTPPGPEATASQIADYRIASARWKERQISAHESFNSAWNAQQNASQGSSAAAPATTTLALSNLKREHTKAVSLLSKSPWPKPENRDGELLAREAAGKVHQRYRAAQAAAKAAEAAATAAAEKKPWWTPLALGTNVASKIAAQAAAKAAEAREIAEREASILRENIEAAKTRGRAIAGMRTREQAAWEISPAISNSREQKRLIELAAAGIKAGDSELVKLAAEDPLAAMAQVQRRELERQRLEPGRDDESISIGAQEHHRDSHRAGARIIPVSLPGLEKMRRTFLS